MNYLDSGLGINTFVNPLSKDGILIHSVNFNSDQYATKTKRTGYTTFLGTADGAQVNSLHMFPNVGNNASTFYLLRASGSLIYSSAQGTGAWTQTGNGTISNTAHFGGAILNNVFVGGDGVGSTRHTTDGTSFTNTSLAPIAEHFEEYQGRIYASGTQNYVSYSSAGDGTNWNTSGTSDSATFLIPGQGKLGKVFKNTDRLLIPKTTGEMYKWDGYTLIDMTTQHGPSSPYAIDSIEGYSFFPNRMGIFGYAGASPTLLSNPIQRQFYNQNNTGIAGTTFDTIPGVCHRYDYLASVGNITDDFTGRQITNTIIKYDYQKNEFLNWSFANKPTSFLSYNDASGNKQLIFGDASGQCYQMDNTLFTDNGSAINAELVYLFTYGFPEFEKKWNYWRGFLNPGCEAKVQIACSDVYTYENLEWVDLGDVSNGVVEYRFTQGRNRSRFLFVRIYDSSKNSRTSFYGQNISADVLEIK